MKHKTQKNDFSASAKKYFKNKILPTKLQFEDKIEDHVLRKIDASRNQRSLIIQAEQMVPLIQEEMLRSYVHRYIHVFYVAFGLRISRIIKCNLRMPSWHNTGNLVMLSH
jgi:hypothetical protein